MKRFLLAACAGIALLGSTMAAVPQDEWLQQVRRQIQRSGAALENQGFSLTHQIYTGSLDDDAETMVSLSLDIGTSYAIMGACDNDCTDVDLTLYDPRGNQVDIDIEADDYPVVTVEPSRTGTYRVKVTMATCNAEPCRYGIGVFGR